MTAASGKGNPTKKTRRKLEKKGYEKKRRKQHVAGVFGSCTISLTNTKKKGGKNFNQQKRCCPRKGS